MAIVDMDKISIIGLESDKEKIIESIMKMGVVEVSDFIPDEEWADLVEKNGTELQVADLEADILRVQPAIDYLSKYNQKKQGLFAPKKEITRSEYEAIIKDKANIWNVVNEIGLYDEKLTQLRSEENRLNNLIATLEPWKPLTIPVNTEGTRYTTVLLGVVPAMVDTKKMAEDLKQNIPESELEVINTDKDQSYLFILYYSSYEKQMMEILKQYGFSRVTFKDFHGTAEDNIQKAMGEIEKIKEERERIIKQIAVFAGEKDRLEVLYDYLVVQRDRKRAIGRLVNTESTFMLRGWLPRKLSEKVRQALLQKWDCVVEITSPEKGEEFPVLLRNHSLVQPFELITEMYSLPKSTEIDPNIIMAPFYFMFFGLMIGDAGYGLIMTIVTAVILKKYKTEGIINKLLRLLFLGGISTFIWGAMFGGWFGDFPSRIGITDDKIVNGIWFNPINDPMKLLIWSFIFGGIHLYAALGLQAYKLIRGGKPWDALFDVGFWYLFLTGLVLFGVGKGVLNTIGKYMSVAGAVGLILTQGRNEKNIIKRLVSGVLSLYGVTGYLSDVLSYSRILALGLATGVIASVINTIGSLFGTNVMGIIIFVIVFIGGHIFNIAINALGAYVHSSRLQYVEFFGKFYEGGGKAFNPLKIQTKYINLKNEEAM